MAMKKLQFEQRFDKTELPESYINYAKRNMIMEIGFELDRQGLIEFEILKPDEFYMGGQIRIKPLYILTEKQLKSLYDQLVFRGLGHILKEVEEL